MFSKKNLKLRLGLTLAAMSCLTSCAPISYNCGCPVYPVAGPKVAAELEKVSYSEFPNTWEWIGRIDKLRQELELCR